MLTNTLPRAAMVMALSAALLTLAGCASVAPPSGITDAAKRYATLDTLSPAAAQAGVRLGLPSREWWRELADAQLNELVERAMTSNHSRLAALAAVREARLLAGAADHAARPQGSLSGAAQITRPSSAEVDPYEQGLSRPPERRLASMDQMVSWELDLFGRIGTATAVAQRQADSAAADAHATTALLQAEVVRHYIVLRQQQLMARQLEAEWEIQRQRHDLLQARSFAGLNDRREAIAARADMAAVQTGQAATRATIARESAALAVLAGQPPTRSDPDWQALLAPAPLPGVPATAALAQPSELLANRPDVARADAQLRAALGEAVLAKRAHLPRLSINLTAGLNAAFGNLGQADALRYAAGPALQWDWLDAGRISLRAEAAKAGAERAWHQFEQAVLTALEDSENSLHSWSSALTTLQAAQEAERAASAAARYTTARTAAGIETKGAALEHALSHLRQQGYLAARHAEALQAFTQVQLSLAAWQP